MPGRGRPKRASVSPGPATRNGDIRSMFSRQAALKNKSPPDASPSPAAKKARRDSSQVRKVVSLSQLESW